MRASIPSGLLEEDVALLEGADWVGEVDRRNPAYARWIQRSLNRVTGARLAVDGDLGARTIVAIRNFQRGRGLTADGVVGPVTERALLAAGAELPPAGAAAVSPSMRQSAQRADPASPFKDSPALRAAALVPTAAITIDRAGPSIQRRLALTYNRLGGLMVMLGREARIEVPTVLAVWDVESGGRTHTPGQAIIRFENHLFHRAWGRQHPDTYDRYLRHGGHRGQPGRPWENHEFRERSDEAFRAFHGNQSLEYGVLALATGLGGEDPALSSISIGGPQILVANHALIGYRKPREMFDEFQAGEPAHVLGFFDFCRRRPAPRPGDLLGYLRARRWSDFARYYNGPGQVETYGGRLANAYSHARALPHVA